jgi:hypothetical protein
LQLLNGVLGGDKAPVDTKAGNSTGKAGDAKAGDAKAGAGKGGDEVKKLPGGSKTGGYCYPMTGKVRGG